MQHCFSTCSAALLQNKFHVFVVRFTVAYNNKNYFLYVLKLHLVGIYLNLTAVSLLKQYMHLFSFSIICTCIHPCRPVHTLFQACESYFRKDEMRVTYQCVA